MSDLIVPKELTQLERDSILSHFKGLLEAKMGPEKTRFFDFHLPGKPALFIKRTYDVLAEASTQAFFYTLAQGDESAPLIPKVFDAFRQEGYCFLVMEKVDAPTLSTCGISEEEAVERAASAVKWLFDQMPSIPDSVFGRIVFEEHSEEEALVWHRFFKDHQSPVPFVNSEALLKYVLRAFTRFRRSARPSPSVVEEFSTSFLEGVSIYHSDIRKSNFLFDPTTKRIWMIDFQHVGVLPKPFQTFAFFNTWDPFPAAVGRKLGYEPSDVADLMANVSNMLQQTGENASLRLDKWGNPIPSTGNGNDGLLSFKVFNQLMREHVNLKT